MDKPLIVVNFKTYQSASGESAEQLAKVMEQFVNRNYRMIAVVSAFDLYSISTNSDNLRFGHNILILLEKAVTLVG